MPCLLRRTAALLASIALLAVPARGALACAMGAAAVEETPDATTHAATHAATHAHHVAPTAPPTGTPADQPHPPCDHLVGCAPVALAIGAVQLPEIGSASAAAVPFIAHAARSPVRALEPPPPKR